MIENVAEARTGINAVTIVRVDHEDQALRVLVIMSPQRSNLILSSDIPNCETNVLILHCFDIESYHRSETIENQSYAKLSTDKRSPIVGIVVTTSPSFNLYRIVV